MDKDKPRDEIPETDPQLAECKERVKEIIDEYGFGSIIILISPTHGESAFNFPKWTGVAMTTQGPVAKDFTETPDDKIPAMKKAWEVTLAMLQAFPPMVALIKQIQAVILKHYQPITTHKTIPQGRGKQPFYKGLRLNGNRKK